MSDEVLINSDVPSNEYPDLDAIPGMWIPPEQRALIYHQMEFLANGPGYFPILTRTGVIATFFGTLKDARQIAGPIHALGIEPSLEIDRELIEQQGKPAKASFRVAPKADGQVLGASKQVKLNYSGAWYSLLLACQELNRRSDDGTFRIVPKLVVTPGRLREKDERLALRSKIGEDGTSHDGINIDTGDEGAKYVDWSTFCVGVIVECTRTREQRIVYLLELPVVTRNSINRQLVDFSADPNPADKVFAASPAETKEEILLELEELGRAIAAAICFVDTQIPVETVYFNSPFPLGKPNRLSRKQVRKPMVDPLDSGAGLGSQATSAVLAAEMVNRALNGPANLDPVTLVAKRGSEELILVETNIGAPAGQRWHHVNGAFFSNSANHVEATARMADIADLERLATIALRSPTGAGHPRILHSGMGRAAAAGTYGQLMAIALNRELDAMLAIARAG